MSDGLSAVWQHFFSHPFILLDHPFSLLPLYAVLSCPGPNIIMHMSRVPQKLFAVVLRQTLARHYAAPLLIRLCLQKISTHYNLHQD